MNKKPKRNYKKELAAINKEANALYKKIDKLGDDFHEEVLVPYCRKNNIETFCTFDYFGLRKKSHPMNILTTSTIFGDETTFGNFVRNYYRFLDKGVK